jgi:hypothetical protein
VRNKKRRELKEALMFFLCLFKETKSLVREQQQVSLDDWSKVQ